MQQVNIMIHKFQSNHAPDALDTLKELADNFADYEKTADINTALNNKVDTIGDQTINGNKTFSGDSEFNNINFTGHLHKTVLHLQVAVVVVVDPVDFDASLSNAKQILLLIYVVTTQF